MKAPRNNHLQGQGGGTTTFIVLCDCGHALFTAQWWDSLRECSKQKGDEIGKKPYGDT